MPPAEPSRGVFACVSLFLCVIVHKCTCVHDVSVFMCKSLCGRIKLRGHICMCVGMCRCVSGSDIVLICVCTCDAMFN